MKRIVLFLAFCTRTPGAKPGTGGPISPTHESQPKILGTPRPTVRATAPTTKVGVSPRSFHANRGRRLLENTQSPHRRTVSWNFMLRVRFAPSPTGYLHIGSARTFIFNWLYARHCGGTMILRIDDTDVERNTQVSLDSIFDGLKWLELGWDEQYRQSDRVELHHQMAGEILAKGLAYRDFTPASEMGPQEANVAEPRGETHWLFNAG